MGGNARAKKAATAAPLLARQGACWVACVMTEARRRFAYCYLLPAGSAIRGLAVLGVPVRRVRTLCYFRRCLQEQQVIELVTNMLSQDKISAAQAASILQVGRCDLWVDWCWKERGA